MYFLSGVNNGILIVEEKPYKPFYFLDPGLV